MSDPLWLVWLDVWLDVRDVFLDHALGEPTNLASPARGDPASRCVPVPPVPVPPAHMRQDNARLGGVDAFFSPSLQRHDHNLSGKSYT